MIKYDYEITVNGNTAKLNKDIHLFRENKNVHYYFAIKNASFNFKGSTDLIEKTNAINAAVTVIKPNGVEVANAIAPVEDGLIHLKVTEDLIDEEVEVGDFDLVFDLFDDNEGAVTIPKIKGQFHVQERPCTTSIGILSGNVNVVNQAVVDLAIATQENEQLIVVDDDGKYVKTTWAKGDKISVERLNKMEEGIYNNSSRLKNIGTGGSTNASDITITDVNDNFESANVEGALNELGTQYKDIANNQPTDLSLDSATNLLQLVNSKGSKLGNGITLPISSGGGTSQYLHIKYSSTGAPQLAGQISDTPNAYIGLCVDTNADSPTNPKNYTWYNWKGDNGDTGATPNLQIGTVETLESGSSATASITGTTENPLLNLGIPRGADGTSGTGGSSEKEWEYIETIETTEEVRSVVKNFDKEYSELYIKMFVENNSADATGILTFKVNDKALYTTNTTPFAINIGKLGSNSRELLIVNSLHPLIFSAVNALATNTWSTDIITPLNRDTYEDSNFSVGEKISKIELFAGSSTTTFATGAKFIIYGR